MGCLKEFWLPVPSASNPPEAEVAPDAKAGDGWKKHYLPLDAQYRTDFLGLDIRSAVQQSSSSPFLVIHGSGDMNVPLENGEELFEAAAEPKKMLVIKKANHLLTNSKDFDKA